MADEHGPYCEDCGDCYVCYGGDTCMVNASGRHRFISEEEEAE